MPNTWEKAVNLDAEGRYVYTYTADQASPSGVHMILETQNKFVDKNLFVRAIVPAGALSAGSTTVNAAAANAGSLLTEVGSAPANGPYITVSGSGSVSVGTAGWLGTSASQSSTSATKYYKVAEASFDADGGSIKAITGGYIAANTTAGTVASGTITNNTTLPSGSTAIGTINRGNYIKISSGYYDVDRYYLAQSNGGGTFTVTAAGDNQNIDGYATLNVPEGALTVAGGGLSAGAGHGELTNNGYYNGTTYDTSDIIDITTQTTAANGYYKLTATGYGSVSRAAITKRITSAGWLAADSSAVQVIDSGSLQSNSGTAVYYVKKSTLSANSVNSSNSNQTVTISAGYYPSARTITINAMTTVTLTTAYTNTGMSTYFTTGTSSDKDVTITPNYSNTAAGYISTHNATTNGGIGYWKIRTATPAFDGGTLTGASTASSTNATISDSTNNSGIEIQTKYSASRAAVLYNGTVTGWVTVDDNATALAAGNLTETNGTKYYINAVTVNSGKSFSVTNNGTTTVTNTGTLTATSNSTSTGTITIAAKTASSDSSNTSQQVVTNGLWKTTTITANTSSAQTAYGRVVVNKLTAGTISTSTTDPGNSYQANTDAIVPANGYLVISAGYHDATKISMDTLLHDSATITGVSGVSNVLLAGYTAYDTDGNLLAGNIQTYDGSYSIS